MCRRTTSRATTEWPDSRCCATFPSPRRTCNRIYGEIDPEEAAQRYAARLGDTPLDLVLLGMGDDGHTASLFPNTPALGEATARTVVTESPKPPHTRISLSLRTLGEARRVLFVVAGASKAERLSEVLAQAPSPSPTLPAAMIRPANGPPEWFVDELAATRLGSHR